MNLLVTGAWSDAGAYIPELVSMGHFVRFAKQETDPLPCTYDWVEGVICNGLFLHHPIENFVNLKYIQLTSAGFDRVPMRWVEEKHIEIHNARGVYSIPMAEFTLAGILQIYKQFPTFAARQKNHIWEKSRDLAELFGKTVCILGCGSVGGECAKRFRAFGCKVIGIDALPRTDGNYDRMLLLSEFRSVLAETDILVLTLPLTEETRGMIDKDVFAQIKAGAVLVNIARGGIVDSEALLAALPRLRGVLLDTFSQEPLAEDSALWDAENVILTPHNSFVGDGNGARLAKVIFNHLENLL